MGPLEPRHNLGSLLEVRELFEVLESRRMWLGPQIRVRYDLWSWVAVKHGLGPQRESGMIWGLLDVDILSAFSLDIGV